MRRFANYGPRPSVFGHLHSSGQCNAADYKKIYKTELEENVGFLVHTATVKKMKSELQNCAVIPVEFYGRFRCVAASIIRATTLHGATTQMTAIFRK
jgi:hypothetical protein